MVAINKKLAITLVLSGGLLVACKPDERPAKPSETTATSQVLEQVIVKNEPAPTTVETTTSTEEGVVDQPNELTFDQHEYTYEVVSGATQTTFGTTPPALYSKEEKAAKMFWSNQPPLGLLSGNYYQNEGGFDGGNYGIVEVVTAESDHHILDVEFTEFARDPYYEAKYSGINKRLSDYAFFQASNTRTDTTLVTVVNGITYVENQMRNENRVTGNFLTVNGSSTSARSGFMPLAAELDDRIGQASPQKYQGFSKELENGVIARLQVVTEDKRIVDVRYDEYFADQPEKMSDTDLQEFFRQSKYYSLDYHDKFGLDFVTFVDELKEKIIKEQTLEFTDEKLSKNPSFAIFQDVAKELKLD